MKSQFNGRVLGMHVRQRGRLDVPNFSTYDFLKYLDVD